MEKANSKSKLTLNIFEGVFPDKLSSTSPQLRRSMGLGLEASLVKIQSAFRMAILARYFEHSFSLPSIIVANMC